MRVDVMYKFNDGGVERYSSSISCTVCVDVGTTGPERPITFMYEQMRTFWNEHVNGEMMTHRDVNMFITVKNHSRKRLFMKLQ